MNMHIYTYQRLTRCLYLLVQWLRVGERTSTHGIGKRLLVDSDAFKWVSTNSIDAICMASIDISQTFPGSGLLLTQVKLQRVVNSLYLEP